MTVSGKSVYEIADGVKYVDENVIHSMENAVHRAEDPERFSCTERLGD